MVLTTSNGEEFEAELAMPISTDGSLLILLRDARPLSLIAADFEGLDWVETDQGERWDGFGDLRILSRTEEDRVQLRLYKEG